MMKFIEQVGNISVYTKQFADSSIEVHFYNGSDLVAKETYFGGTEEKAIANLFSRNLDTYTEEWLKDNFIMELVKLSDNTYRTSDTDYFCRIDDTRYFKHFNKSADEFVTDKNGMRIIDR
ncbi:MAG: hypothetical protein IJN54_06880 [Lachnospiraceae bacterium]|nr:hypothetical protein [Lachnospiraceae bacterium]